MPLIDWSKTNRSYQTMPELTQFTVSTFTAAPLLILATVIFTALFAMLVSRG